MTKRLSNARPILLFRYHTDAANAVEKIRIIQHFNPGLEIHVLDGGYPPHFEKRKVVIEQAGVESVWLYPPNKTPSWKWRHTYQLVKDWYRAIGKTLDFDFVFSYEYDLVTTAPLLELYPDIDDNSIALGAVTDLTDEVGRKWTWTNGEAERLHRELSFSEFEEFMAEHYGQARQRYVCLGPGSLFSRKFMDKWADIEDISYVHEEILYPALAQAFGMNIVNHGMHPGFYAADDDERYFNCHDDHLVTLSMIREQLALGGGKRAFHPVKEMTTLEGLGLA